MQQTLSQTNKTQQSTVIFLYFAESEGRKKLVFFQWCYRNKKGDVCGKLFLLPPVIFKNKVT